MLGPLLGLLLGLAGCNQTPGICDGAELSQAETSLDEAEAMQRFRDECRPLSMRAFDSSGEAIPFSSSDWMTRVHRISLSGAGRRLFDHQVIEGKNVGLLMGE